MTTPHLRHVPAGVRKASRARRARLADVVTWPTKSKDKFSESPGVGDDGTHARRDVPVQRCIERALHLRDFGQRGRVASEHLRKRRRPHPSASMTARRTSARRTQAQAPCRCAGTVFRGRCSCSRGRRRAPQVMRSRCAKSRAATVSSRPSVVARNCESNFASTSSSDGAPGRPRVAAAASLSSRLRLRDAAMAAQRSPRPMCWRAHAPHLLRCEPKPQTAANVVQERVQLRGLASPPLRNGSQILNQNGYWCICVYVCACLRACVCVCACCCWCCCCGRRFGSQGACAASAKPHLNGHPSSANSRLLVLRPLRYAECLSRSVGLARDTET